MFATVSFLEHMHLDNYRYPFSLTNGPDFVPELLVESCVQPYQYDLPTSLLGFRTERSG